MKNHDLAYEEVGVRHVAFTLGLLLAILLTCCTPPPSPGLQPLPDLCGSLFPVTPIRPGTAFGEVTIRNNSEELNGSVDVKQEKAGCLKADFYGPFGIAVASLKADSLQGTMAFEDRTYTFALNQTMHTLPLEWGKDLIFSEFLQIILGRIPKTGAETLCKKQPDSLVKKRNTIYALWKTDSLEIRVEINNRSREVTAINCCFKKQAPFWWLKMGVFHRGIAHKIQFMENDENYFLIHYTKVKL